MTARRSAPSPRPLPDDFLSALHALADAYLAHDDPIRQSGFGGGAARWRAEREPILDAVPAGGGALLDVGCANGHLLECLLAWGAERGLAIEPFGLEQSTELAEIARRRLPGFAANFFVGNAWSWEPPRRFRTVYSLCDVVPPDYRIEYARRIADRLAEPGGRVVLGAYGSVSRRTPPADVARLLRDAGLAPCGETSGGALPGGGGPVVRFAWADAP